MVELHFFRYESSVNQKVGTHSVGLRPNHCEISPGGVGNVE